MWARLRLPLCVRPTPTTIPNPTASPATFTTRMRSGGRDINSPGTGHGMGMGMGMELGMRTVTFYQEWEFGLVMSCEICKYAKASQLQDDNALTSTLLLAHTLMYNLEAKWLPFCGPAGVSRDQKKLNGAKSGPARTTTTGYKKPPWRGHPFILEQGTQGVQWPGRET
uniref:HDC12162 n=1 Tax=Drosophila melanogaster TaxID=7227 RepID=Q6IKL4_DROME|nr:TPA_inf: HDC12162 [Drosophila melanogaster]